MHSHHTSTAVQHIFCSYNTIEYFPTLHLLSV